MANRWGNNGDGDRLYILGVGVGEGSGVADGSDDVSRATIGSFGVGAFSSCFLVVPHRVMIQINNSRPPIMKGVLSLFCERVFFE